MRSSWSALTDDAVEVLGTWAEDPGGTDPEATAWGVFIPLYESEERAQEEAATRLDRVLGALECEARIRAFLERECLNPRKGRTAEEVMAAFGRLEGWASQERAMATALLRTMNAATAAIWAGVAAAIFSLVFVLGGAG